MCEGCDQNLKHSLTASRRKFLFIAASVGLSLTSASAKEKKEAETKPPKPQNVLSPDASLQRLLKGNARLRRGRIEAS
jgi:carbonic anhydrase